MTFLGSIAFTELASLYRDAIAVIAPSIGYETFGMTSIEGFATGRPRSSATSAPFPSRCSNSGGGFVFRTDRELLDALDALQSDRALRDEMGRRGYEGWRARWSDASRTSTSTSSSSGT